MKVPEILYPDKHREQTRCKHGTNLEGDRIQWIDGTNYCQKCELNQ